MSTHHPYCVKESQRSVQLFTELLPFEASGGFSGYLLSPGEVDVSGVKMVSVGNVAVLIRVRVLCSRNRGAILRAC